MGKLQDFIKNENEYYGKIFSDISYAIDNVYPFLDDNIKESRKYITKIPVLKKYIEILSSADEQSKKIHFFNFTEQNNIYDLLTDYKKDNIESLKQLEKCSRCKCLNCISTCRFDSCAGCRENSFIEKCDHKKINITSCGSFTIDLTNNRTGISDKYNVLGILQDIESSKKYIAVQNIRNREKYILYYTPGIVEDKYGEIDNKIEFDYISEQFQNIWKAGFKPALYVYLIS